MLNPDWYRLAGEHQSSDDDDNDVEIHLTLFLSDALSKFLTPGKELSRSSVSARSSTRSSTRENDCMRSVFLWFLYLCIYS